MTEKKNGWIKECGEWVLYRDGKAVTGGQKMAESIEEVRIDRDKIIRIGKKIFDVLKEEPWNSYELAICCMYTFHLFDKILQDANFGESEKGAQERRN